MLSENRKTVLSKIILYMLHLTLLYLMTVCIFFPLLHAPINMLTSAIPIVVAVFLFIFEKWNKTERIEKKEERYIGLRVLVAIFIDIIFSIFILGLFGILSVLLPVMFFYFLVTLLIAIILGYNVFFTSFGYKLLNIYCYLYKIPVLFYNAFFLFCFIGVFIVDNLLIYIIFGLYAGFDSIFLFIKKTPFFYYIFKINYYRKQRIVRASTRGPREPIIQMAKRGKRNETMKRPYPNS